MPTRRLTEVQFRATLSAPMQNLTGSGESVLDIWPYGELVLTSDLAGHTEFAEFVEAAYRSADGRFDHDLVMTRTTNACLAVVAALLEDGMHEHYLLD